MNQDTTPPAPTPLTDAAVYEEDTGYNGVVKVVSPDFARSLERDNARLREALDGIATQYEKLMRQLDADDDDVSEDDCLAKARAALTPGAKP